MKFTALSGNKDSHGKFSADYGHRRHQRGWRGDVGRAILLGLEFLIAGDLIRTVVVAPTMQNVLVLGLIVLIRTFLSFSLQLEIEGKLPWQRDATRPD